jgi:hypothetical protein
MRRIVGPIMLLFLVLPTGGCGALGWFRGMGDFPGVAPSEYAFYDWWGTASQLYPFSPQQVKSSALQALGDLGFTIDKPPERSDSGEVLIEARTPDGRPTHVTVTPQNNLTNLRIKIGPVHLGDQMLSRDIFKRVSLNYGALPRVYTPMEPVLARRTNIPGVMPPQVQTLHIETLIGEGLRPGETRGTTGEEESAAVPPIGVAPVPPTMSPYFAPSPLFQFDMNP